MMMHVPNYSSNSTCSICCGLIQTIHNKSKQVEFELVRTFYQPSAVERRLIIYSVASVLLSVSVCANTSCKQDIPKTNLWILQNA